VDRWITTDVYVEFRVQLSVCCASDTRVTFNDDGADGRGRVIVFENDVGPPRPCVPVPEIANVTEAVFTSEYGPAIFLVPPPVVQLNVPDLPDPATLPDHFRLDTHVAESVHEIQNSTESPSSRMISFPESPVAFV
jgi:hypothetical protein